jgi:hypothetical protein
MAVLASIATGNFTSASTWGTVDSTSYLNAENTFEVTLTTAYSGCRSSAFTPGAIEISHIGVKLCERIGTTGTMSVQLELDSGDTAVAGTEVTIDVADLPSALETNADGGWILFKLASPVTLLAATAYQVAAKTSSATQVELWKDGTSQNIARVLVTTTTAAPSAGDDLIVAGERTGSGTGNSFTVTCDNTATTDFGSAPTQANSIITPGLSVCARGTFIFGTSSATNYYLKMSNCIIVYSGGTFNVGTTGTPIPRDSTAVIEFDGAADVDYGFLARNGSTVTMQGLSRTSGKNIVSCKLNTDEAANQTTLGVDTDTGWLDNDAIAVASTTRTSTQGEAGTLNGDAGASSLTVDGFAGAGGGLANAHSGTAPTQAEVILLTRNVILRSATSTVMTYFVALGSASVDIDWVEFRYLGEDITNKRAVDVEVTTGTVDIQYCSLRDNEDYGVYIAGGVTSGSVTISNNVFWNCNNALAGGSGVIKVNAVSSGSVTISGNVLIGCSSPNAANAAQIWSSDASITLTNNTIAGGGGGTNSVGLIIADSATQLGTISGNTIHSVAGVGSTNTQSALYGTISNMTIWRCSSQGWTWSAGSYGVTLDTATLFGNNSENMIFSGGGCNFLLKSFTVNGDASFSVATGIFFSGNGIVHIKDSSFGATTTHTTADIRSQNNGAIRVYCFNTTVASTEASVQTGGNNTQTLFSFHKKDASSTTFDNYYSWGRIASDTTTRHTASGYSWKLTPSNASQKLILPGPTTFDTFKVAVNASALVTIKVWAYKDATYNGTAPRLVLVGGIIGGIASDVTASLTVAHSNWEELTVTGTPNEAGTIEFYCDADGTAGSAYFDDFTISQA